MFSAKYNHDLDQNNSLTLVPFYFKKSTTFSKEKIADLVTKDITNQIKLYISLTNPFPIETILNLPIFLKTKDQLIRQAWKDYQDICELIHLGLSIPIDLSIPISEAGLNRSNLSKITKLEYTYRSYNKEPFDIIPIRDIYNNLDVINIPRITFGDDPMQFNLPAPDQLFKFDGTSLIYSISNTDEPRALKLISLNADVNKYSIAFGNTALILAISKGWNHKNREEGSRNGSQRSIILSLLNQKNIDINAIHVRNGMTALHIACLRGDSPEIIKLLLKHGADTTRKDFQGRMPFDLLKEGYQHVKNIISLLTGEYPLEHLCNQNEVNITPAISRTATLLSQNDRENNAVEIAKILEEQCHKKTDKMKQEKKNIIFFHQHHYDSAIANYPYHSSLTKRTHHNALGEHDAVEPSKKKQPHL